MTIDYALYKQVMEYLAQYLKLSDKINQNASRTIQRDTRSVPQSLITSRPSWSVACRYWWTRIPPSTHVSLFKLNRGLGSSEDGLEVW